jgi:putative hydrolase of the HAD superfamily
MCEGLRWVLFDAVGTLIHPDPPAHEVYHAAGRQFGSQLDVGDVAARFHSALAVAQNCDGNLTRPQTSEFAELARWRRIVTGIFDDVPPPAISRLFQSLWLHFAEAAHWRLYDDVAPALKELSRQGRHVGIASNFDGRLPRIVSQLPGLALCERVFVSSQVGYIKPDPRFFLSVQEQLSAEPAEILIVGDDLQADIEGARAARWHAAWLQRDGQPAGQPCLRSLAELAAV